ncbi:hypothetical protein [Arenimonas aestuarii]
MALSTEVRRLESGRAKGIGLNDLLGAVRCSPSGATANPPNDTKEQSDYRESNSWNHEQAGLLVKDDRSVSIKVATLLVEQASIWPIEQEEKETE